MKIAVTGFGAFPGVAVNISESLISAWQTAPPQWGVEVELSVLPTSYQRAGDEVARIVTESRPDLLIMLGVAPMAGTLRIERFALNIDDSKSPDADGDVRMGRAIVAGKAMALSTAIDVASLRDAAVARGLEADVSNHAGTYVCNHAYYRALLAARRRSHRTRVLFIHLPNAVDADKAERIRVLEHCKAAVDGVVRDLIGNAEGA
ncbi:pyroglutamyl-peptidase I [soil metagenome]